MLWWEFHEMKLKESAGMYDYMKIYHKEYAIVGRKNSSGVIQYGIIGYKGHIYKECIYDRITDIQKRCVNHCDSQTGSTYFHDFECELYKNGQYEKWNSSRPVTSDEPPFESY